MEDLSYLTTEYARQKMIESYDIEYASTANKQSRKACDPAEAKARDAKIIKEGRK